jgi:hypothetical protein
MPKALLFMSIGSSKNKQSKTTTILRKYEAIANPMVAIGDTRGATSETKR